MLPLVVNASIYSSLPIYNSERFITNDKGLQYGLSPNGKARLQ